jgi:hypothetical protein
VKRPPAWAIVSLSLFCVAELVLVEYGRISSAMGHLHAVQTVTPSTPDTAAAACAEANAAAADLWPALPLLNVARLVPMASVQAWGQVPRLAEAGQLACQSVEVYANLAPWPDGSIERGAGADLLADMRSQRAEMATAADALTRAWRVLDSIDSAALAADPRLDRVARLVDSARAQQADISDALALAAPGRIETLLGGQGPRSLVLGMADTGVDGQAYAVIQEGRVVSVDVGQPPVTPAGSIVVDRVGLATLVEAVGGVAVLGLRGSVVADDSPAIQPRDSTGVASGAVARAMLLKIGQLRLSDDLHVVAALKQSADAQHAWFAFDDPALQALAARRGWVRQ